MNTHETSRSKRKRPENTPHTADSLRDLAECVKSHAKLLGDVAARLEKAAGRGAVKVNFQTSVDDGLAAIRLLVGDVEKKIDQKKFADYVGTEETKKKLSSSATIKKRPPL